MSCIKQTTSTYPTLCQSKKNTCKTCSRGNGQCACHCRLKWKVSTWGYCNQQWNKMVQGCPYMNFDFPGDSANEEDWFLFVGKPCRTIRISIFTITQFNHQRWERSKIDVTLIKKGSSSTWVEPVSWLSINVTALEGQTPNNPGARPWASRSRYHSFLAHAS
jgi:hypothetical protein